MKTLAAVLGLLFVAASLGRSADPSDLDKKVTSLVGKLGGQDARLRLEAIAALGELGPDARKAAPALVGVLKVRDDDARLHGVLALGKVGKDAVGPVAAALGDRDADVRYYAVWALGLIGPDAKDKAPDVVKLVGDGSPEVRRKAAFALGRIAPDPALAGPALVKALADPEGEVRQAAVEALGGLGAGAVPHLVGALRSQAGVRVLAVKALSLIGPDAADAVPQIAALLSSQDTALAAAAADCLARVGRAAIPALRDALGSDDPNVRRLAVGALAKVDGSAGVGVFMEALKSPRWEVRAEAARSLGELRVNDKAVVLALADRLDRDESVHVRHHAATALVYLDSFDGLAGPALARAVADDHHDVRAAAFNALQAHNLDPTAAARRRLEGDDARLKINAAAALVENNSPDRDLGRQALTVALEQKAPEHRYRAAFILARLQMAPGGTVAVLTEALADGKPDVRELAAERLATLARTADAAEPALIGALKDDNPAVRRMSCWALSQTGADGKKTLEALADRLSADMDATVRLAAVGAINRRFVDEATPLYLQVILKDTDPNVRNDASNYLGASKAVHKAMIPTLVDLAKNEKQTNVRLNAINALRNLGDEGLPSLIDLLAASDDRGVQYAVMSSLREFGAKAKKAVPRLVEILKKGQDYNRHMAALTLGVIGPDARDATDALKEAARDADPELRRCAELALGQIAEKK